MHTHPLQKASSFRYIGYLLLFLLKDYKTNGFGWSICDSRGKALRCYTSLHNHRCISISTGMDRKKKDHHQRKMSTMKLRAKSNDRMTDDYYDDNEDDDEYLYSEYYDDEIIDTDFEYDYEEKLPGE